MALPYAATMPLTVFGGVMADKLQAKGVGTRMTRILFCILGKYFEHKLTL